MMVVMILGYLLSLIPTLAFFFWIRSRQKNDAAYRKLCDQAMLQGFLCVFAIIVLSGCFYLAIALTGLKNAYPLLYQALYTFIALALAEEIVKYLTFRRVLKKTDDPYSWLDVALVMTLVGLGFGASENIMVAFTSGIPTMAIRAVTVPHGGYGFIAGYFYGYGMKTGEKHRKYLGYLIAWLLHGLYDFSLSKEFVAINENLMFVALALAALDLVLAITLIVFFARAGKDAKYTEPLSKAEEAPKDADL